MLLQLALDTPHAGTVRRLLDETAGDVDIIELGTPLLIRYGVDIVAGIRRDHPDKKMLADLKIADAGDLEAGLAFDAGADIVTVLGSAHPATLRDACERAKRSGGGVMADLITVRTLDEAIPLARRLDRSGLDFICMHTAFDARGQGDAARNLEGIGPGWRSGRTGGAGRRGRTGPRLDKAADTARPGNRGRWGLHHRKRRSRPRGPCNPANHGESASNRWITRGPLPHSMSSPGPSWTNSGGR